jgi:predicted nucleic acid-binding protein
LIVSRVLVGELQRALSYPKLRGIIEPSDSRDYVAMLEDRATLVEDPPVERIAPDPEDDFVIALARGAADVFVTGDLVLQVLRIEGLPILSPRVFLETLRT